MTNYPYKVIRVFNDVPEIFTAASTAANLFEIVKSFLTLVPDTDNPYAPGFTRTSFVIVPENDKVIRLDKWMCDQDPEMNVPNT